MRVAFPAWNTGLLRDWGTLGLGAARKAHTQINVGPMLHGKCCRSSWEARRSRRPVDSANWGAAPIYRDRLVQRSFGKVRLWRIPLKNSAVQRYGPVSRVFDGPSETTILQRVPRLGPGYASNISIRAPA